MPDTESLKLDFKAALKEKAQRVNAVISELMAQREDIPARLRSAMMYTLEAPGKRMRAALLMWCCELIAGRVTREAEIAAASVEMVHTYSLIHDDLPAMDDDDLRRGMPTCHKAFGEATAILAGDALLTLAFELTAGEIENPATAAAMIHTLAAAAGPAGMVGGQQADLDAENGDHSAELLRYIHTSKTARMFAASAKLGGLAGGGDPEQLDALYQYGLNIGLAFQVADDILDVSSSSEQLGKTPGKDQAAGKLTYPSLYGIEKSKQIAKDLAETAVGHLGAFDDRADILRHLARALLDRTS